MTTPLYFGAPWRRLYAVYQRPVAAPGRRTGSVLCYPFGSEYLRVHRSFRQLAVQLARIGFPVLRFDYYGSGDSAGDGDAWSIDGALEDIGLAVDEFRARSGCTSVALIGLRLGATLASLAAGRIRDVNALVLWEPVIDGGAYVQSLEAQQRDWARHRVDHGRREAGDTAGLEIVGFPLPPVVRVRLEGLDLLTLDRCHAERVLLLMENDREGLGGRLEAHLTGLAAEVARRHESGPPVWLRQEGMDKTLVPGRALECITAWCGDLP
jgi:pimeloyl-ACP methyl ester carboxylesterase